LTNWLFLLFALAGTCQRVLEIKRHDRRIRGRRPHWTALAMIVVHLAIVMAAVVEVFVVDPPLRWPLRVVGGLLFLAGTLLRAWVIRTLSGQWSIDVQRLEGHRLITSGPFAWCRHPNYLAIGLETLGFCLVGQALWTLAVGLPLYAVIVAARTVAEERMLVETFGDDYRDFRRRRHAFLPLGHWGRNVSKVGDGKVGAGKG
jgi:protein-S-isoprenylcysteine O-methyltransferase Ste14